MSEPIKNRFDFVLLFDVENGNPNGDPDAGNMPRIDPETGIGLVSDVCLKRKVRNYVSLVKDDAEEIPVLGDDEGVGYKIYVQERAILNRQNERAYSYYGIKPDKKTPSDERIRAFMCRNFFDVRSFGAVMTTEVNCGQVRGPVQFCFAKSADPVMPQEMTITRMAVTNERDVEKERTMGRKQYVPYALYRAEGFVSAPLAADTGFCDADLALLWEALANMFEHDRSAARGKMTSRKLFVFKHDSKLGNAPSGKLFDMISISKKGGVVPRSFSDYTVSIDSSAAPAGVELQELL